MRVLVLPLLVLAMGACAQTPRGDSAAGRPPSAHPTETAITRNAEVSRDDGAIAEDVRKAIQAEAMLQPKDIQVRAQDGEVRLTGVVRSPDERQRAEGLARGVPGVKHVENRLELSK
jgi:hyperosmotically inducible protein